MEYACCGEHVELALDLIVDEFEVAPSVEKPQNLSTTCEFCQSQATYIVTNECFSTKC